MKQQYPYIGNPFGFKLPQPKPVVHPIITRWEQFTAEDQIILSSIKKVIVSKIGDCNVYLYGSKVNGNWDDNSDYDLLIDKDITFETLLNLRDYDYGVEIDLGCFEKIKDNIPEGVLIY